eukprot:scaffold5031_cov116-Cylindrotheca_fusiformis.AAC.1
MQWVGETLGARRAGRNRKMCGFLTQVDIPETVKLIGNAAFQLCGRLERVGPKEGIENIGEFWECKSLLKLDVPATVKVIDDCAFQLCRCLFRVGLKKDLKELENSFSRDANP